MADLEMPSSAVESWPESRLPAGIGKLPRPRVLARATGLAFLRFQLPNLDRALRFLTDFGMSPVATSADRIAMRGAGSAPCLYMAERRASARFTGAAYTVGADTDLDRVAVETGGRRLDPGEIPGGGDGLALIDPAGFEVWLIREWTQVPQLPIRPPVPQPMNMPDHRPRVNAGIRPALPAAPVIRLGHMVLQVTDFPTMSAWYMQHLGLIPSDVQYLSDGSTALTFFRLDLGDQPADHHTLVLVGGIQNEFEHSAYEMVDLDAIGQRQQQLLAGGHRHMWGIGRHVLGSQLFNYWKDPDGFQFEHYTDGDVFTADYEPRYSPFTAGSIWAWGQDAPAAMRGKPSVAMIWRLIRAVVSGQVPLARLKLMGEALSRPARPWL